MTTLAEVAVDKRVEDLYMALADPKLPVELAGPYMKEYRELTGIDCESGQLVFVDLKRISIDHRHDKIKIGIGAFLLGMWTFTFLQALLEARLAEENKPQTRLEYILDSDRIGSYTAEEFQAVLAEASYLIAHNSLPPHPFKGAWETVEG